MSAEDCVVKVEAVTAASETKVDAGIATKDAVSSRSSSSSKCALDFMLLAGQLKRVPRTGWVLRKVRSPESVADHSWRMGLLALLLLGGEDGGVMEDHVGGSSSDGAGGGNNSSDGGGEGSGGGGGGGGGSGHHGEHEHEKKYGGGAAETETAASAGLDRMRCVTMALVHDLAECIVGDIAPSDGVSKHEKHKREAQAMAQLEAALAPINPNAAREICDLWREYEAAETKEARAVKDIDKFEMILQAYEYERESHAQVDKTLAAPDSGGESATASSSSSSAFSSSSPDPPPVSATAGGAADAADATSIPHDESPLQLDEFFASVKGKIKSDCVRGWERALCDRREMEMEARQSHLSP